MFKDMPNRHDIERGWSTGRVLYEPNLNHQPILLYRMVRIPSIRLDPLYNMTQRLEQIGKLSAPSADVEYCFPTRQQLLNLPKP
jgi:hypothetical protein